MANKTYANLYKKEWNGSISYQPKRPVNLGELVDYEHNGVTKQKGKDGYRCSVVADESKNVTVNLKHTETQSQVSIKLDIKEVEYEGEKSKRRDSGTKPTQISGFGYWVSMRKSKDNDGNDCYLLTFNQAEKSEQTASVKSSVSLEDEDDLAF